MITFQMLSLLKILYTHKYKKIIVNIRGKSLLKRCGNTIANLNHSVTKSRLTDKDKMTSSNNNNYMLKCYINLFNIVPVKMESGVPFIWLSSAFKNV